MRLVRRTLILLAASATALVLAAPAPAAAPAPKPAPKPTKPKAKVKPKPFPRIVVTAELLPGSGATVEIPALPLPGGQVLTGTGVTREVPMTGSISGPLTHRFRIGDDIDVKFEKAAFKLGAIDVLSDPACGGAPTLRLNPANIVSLDTSKPSTAKLRYSGLSSAKAHVKLRLAFDMRTAAGCDQPLVTTGFADTAFTDELSGTVGPRGLVALEMRSAPTTLSVGVCLYPGAPDKACPGGLASYPVKVSVHVTVRISLKREAGTATAKKAKRAA